MPGRRNNGVSMPKCSFCGNELSIGTGTMLVKNEGKILYWCSSKCEGNAALGRNPAKVGWVRKKAKAAKPAQQK
jgi:large subunit ribosomal protein L24e